MGKKKVKKMATKTLNLNDFLAENTSGTYQAPGSGSSFGGEPAIPTAPRASLGQSHVDIEDLPRSPPFQAFVGNLPFEVEEVDLEEFFNGREATVVSVTLKRDTDSGRLRGTGFVEYETRNMLKTALEQNGSMFNGRNIRIELPGGMGGRDGGRYGDRPGGGYDRDAPLRSEEVDSWRSPAAQEGLITRGPGARAGGFGDRGGDRYGDRGGDRYGDRGGDRYGDRGGDRYGDRGSGGGFRADEAGDWRSAPKDAAPARGGYGDRGGDRYGDRGGDRYGDRGGDRYGDRGGDRGGFDTFSRDDRPPAGERPRLQLSQRTVPVGESAGPAATGAKSNPFGAAKPVDTAAKLNSVQVESSKPSARPPSSNDGARSDPFGGARPVDTAAKELAAVSVSEDAPAAAPTPAEQ